MKAARIGVDRRFLSESGTRQDVPIAEQQPLAAYLRMSYMIKSHTRAEIADISGSADALT